MQKLYYCMPKKKNALNSSLTGKQFAIVDLVEVSFHQLYLYGFLNYVIDLQAQVKYCIDDNRQYISELRCNRSVGRLIDVPCRASLFPRRS